MIRPLEPRPVDASRVVRPVEPTRAQEAPRTPPPRAAEPPRPAAPAPAAKPPEPKPEPKAAPAPAAKPPEPKAPPEQRSKAPEKRDPGDKPGDKQK